MIKDVLLRIVFIPLLGVFLPVLSGLIHYKLYTFAELVASNLFFVLTSFCISGVAATQITWRVTQWK